MVIKIECYLYYRFTDFDFDETRRELYESKGLLELQSGFRVFA